MHSRNPAQERKRAVLRRRSARALDEDSTILTQKTSDPAAILEQANHDPHALTPDRLRQLQQTIGNQAVGQLFREAGRKEKETDAGGTKKSSDQSVQVPVAVVQRTKGEGEREKFRDKYSRAASLVEGIDVNGTPTQILDALVQNYIKSDFIYDTTPTTPWDFLNGKNRGDCSTLSKSFVIIAQEYFDIQNISTQSTGSFGIANGGLVLDANNATGNVDGGRHWVFESHTWVVGPDRTRDILFKGVPINPDAWVKKTGEGTEDGIDYREFGGIGGGKVYPYRLMGDTLANKYTTNLALAKSGRAADEAAMAESARKLFSRPPANKKGCYITTACTQAKGLPDNCEELTVLRDFRDTYLLQMPGGEQLVDLYYRFAPDITGAIDRREDVERVYDQLYQVIRSCVEAIKMGDHAFAFRTYCEMVMKLSEEYLVLS